MMVAVMRAVLLKKQCHMSKIVFFQKKSDCHTHSDRL